MSGLANKVVLVTGASSGIGAQVALDFAKAGAKVSLHGRDGNKLQRSLDACLALEGAKPGNLFTVTGDVTKQEDVNHIVDSTVQQFGTIHILINNAGFANMGTLQEIETEHMDAMYHVHIRGPLMLTKRALPEIIKNKGSIINMSSVLGLRPFPQAFCYGVMKAALCMFTQSLAMDLAPKGVRVNAICPGIVKTPFINAVFPDWDDAAVNNCLDGHAAYYPLRKFGTPDEVSAMTLFFASDAASNTTGALIPCSGGVGVATYRGEPTPQI